MLVLSRKIGESIVCNQNIEIKVLSVTGNRVRIGISAPTKVKVVRSEVLERQELEFTLDLETVAS